MDRLGSYYPLRPLRSDFYLKRRVTGASYTIVLYYIPSELSALIPKGLRTQFFEY